MDVKTLLLLVAILFSAVTASAQTVRAARFTFTTGPCVLRSGSGSPEGVVVGNVCDQWHRTDSPYGVYTKRSGTGNTGWLLPASTDLTDTTNLARLNAATNAFTSAMTIGTTLGVTGTISGNLTGNVTGNVTGTSGSTTGNAATATALQTARTIAGVSFNGTANIAIASTDLSDTATLARLAANNSFSHLSGGVITANGPIRVNSNGVAVSGFIDGLNMGAWDMFGYASSPGLLIAIGGYRASQWQGVELYSNGSLRVTLDINGHFGIGVVPTRRFHVLASTQNQFIAAQTTAPTCSASCGTSPSITGSDTFMTVTMGATGTPASGFVITFSGAWPSAPSCVGAMATAGMVIGKLPLTIVTTTTTMTVVTNGTAPSVSNKYHFHCGGF